MKLSFTTLGCPDWDMERIVENAKNYGFDGIDFRGYRGVMEVYELPEFTSGLEETRKQIEQAGLEVSCFSSSVKIVNAGERRSDNIREIEQYTRLCQAFGTRYIRVFGGALGDADRNEAAREASAHLRELCEISGAHGVKLIIETHDDWLSGEHVLMLLDQVDPSKAGVLWDVHHPYRMIGEPPGKTWEALGPRIEYTHWKDSVLTESASRKFKYCLMGEGDIPLKDIYRLLVREGYDGWFTFEWEKKWHPDLAEPEVSFPQFVQFMKSLEAEG